MKHLLSFLFTFLIIKLNAQGNWLNDTIYFNSNSAVISKSDVAESKSKIADLSLNSVEKIIIKGHTDAAGSNTYNERLSEQRVHAVMSLFLKAGFPASKIIKEAYGESMPVSNIFHKNRRVEISIELVVVKQIPVDTFTIEKYTLAKLLSEIKPARQIFCINPAKDTLIKLRQGTLLYYRANSLQTSTCKCVTLETEEAFSKSSIVLNNLHTMTDEKELVSQAMVYTRFSCNEITLPFINDNALVAMTPTDSFNTQALVFKLDTAQNGVTNWHTNGTVPDTFRANQFSCGSLNDVVGQDTACASPCPLFFCKTKRFFRGVFSRQQRDSNRQWRECRRRKREYDKRLLNLTPQQRANVDSFRNRFGTLPLNPASINMSCVPYWDVLKKYNINDPIKLKKAIEADLFDNLDTTENYAKDRAGVLGYYIFNINGPGWNNVDWVFKVPPQNMLEIQVTGGNNYEGILKIVYSKRRSVIDCTEFNNVFKGTYARDEAASLVYIGINNITNKPVIQLIELNDKTLDIVLSPQETTAQDIITKLKSIPAWQ